MTSDRLSEILDLIGPAVLLPITPGTKAPSFKAWQQTTIADSERPSTGSLTAAQAGLDSPDALSMTDEQLARMGAEVRHLPRRITDTQARADALVAEILATAKVGGIDLEALVMDIDRTATTRMAPGSQSPTDSALHSLIQAGHYTLPSQTS